MRATGAPAGTRPDQLDAAAPGKSELTDEQRAEVEELRKRDQEVRRHEQAHKAAAGRYAAGGPTYRHRSGPDGRRYAVEGEVQIDTAEVRGDPEATVEKMRQVRRAALAPAQPSGKDRQIAAEAAAKERSAQVEQSRQDSGALGDAGPTAPGTDANPEARPPGITAEATLLLDAFAAQAAQTTGRFIDVPA